MTEQEWLYETTLPNVLLEFVSKHTTTLDYRCFVCAFARVYWDRVTDRRAKNLIIFAEQYLDNKISFKDLNDLHREVVHMSDYWDISSVGLVASQEQVTADIAIQTSIQIMNFGYIKYVSNMVRDIVGNPYNSVSAYYGGDFLYSGPRYCNLLDNTTHSFHIDKINRDINSIARICYEEPLKDGFLDNTLLNILADAVEDSDINIKVLIDHLRSKEKHCKYCWALTLLRSKT